MNDLEASSQAKHKMKGRLLLDVVIGKGSAILKLLSGKDQPLLVWRDSLLVLDLGLDIFNGVGWLNLQSDGFAGQGLDEDLHATAKTEDEMKGRLLLDVVIGKSSAILKLFASKDETLLIWRDSLLILDLGFDVLDGVRGLDFQGDGLAGEGLNENLHLDC